MKRAFYILLVALTAACSSSDRYPGPLGDDAPFILPCLELGKDTSCIKAFEEDRGSILGYTFGEENGKQYFFYYKDYTITYTFEYNVLKHTAVSTVNVSDDKVKQWDKYIISVYGTPMDIWNDSSFVYEWVFKEMCILYQRSVNGEYKSLVIAWMYEDFLKK